MYTGGIGARWIAGGGSPWGPGYTPPAGFGVDPTTTQPGPGRYGQGSSATGFIPAPPSLQQTSADSIGINLANMAALKQLYDQTANQYVPGYSGLSQQESQNIGQLLNPTDFRDSLRHAAEIGTHAGVTGAPINDAYSAFATHDQKLRDWSLGSQMLGGAATRGKGIMPFENFFVNPQQAYEADWLAKQLQAAPNPAEAYNLNMQNAALGLRQGQRAGYGGGGGNPLGGYGGNMITGAPSRVDQVVNKYSKAIQPPQPSGGGGSVGTPRSSQPFMQVPQDVGPVYGGGLSNLGPLNPNDIYDPRAPVESGSGLPFGPWSPGYFQDNTLLPTSGFGEIGRNYNANDPNSSFYDPAYRQGFSDYTPSDDRSVYWEQMRENAMIGQPSYDWSE